MNGEYKLWNIDRTSAYGHGRYRLFCMVNLEIQFVTGIFRDVFPVATNLLLTRDVKLCRSLLRYLYLLCIPSLLSESLNSTNFCQYNLEFG